MRIKVKNKTYLKFKASENVIAQAKENTHKETPSVTDYYKKFKKTHATLFLSDEGKEIVFSIPFLYEGKLFWGEMHLLPLMYFNHSIDFFNISENILHTFYGRNSKDPNELIQLNPEYYNPIVSYRISSLIFLHTAIDATLNYIIPEDFKYFSEKEGAEIGKEEIEDLRFMTKVKEVFRALFNFNICDDKVYTVITEINKHRRNLIHLNTVKDKKSTEKFFNEMDEAMSFDIQSAIISVINLFKRFKPELFETFEFTNHTFSHPNNKGVISIYHPIINNMTDEDFHQ